MKTHITSKLNCSRMVFLTIIIILAGIIPACGPAGIGVESPFTKMASLFEEEENAESSSASLVDQTDHKEQPNCQLKYDPLTGGSMLDCGELKRRVPFPRINITSIPDVENKCPDSETITSVEIGLDAN